MFSDSFSKFLENTLKNALIEANLKDSLNILAESIFSYYKEVQVSFARSLGKRLCYITGAGSELCKPNDKIQVLNNYYVLIQNSCIIPEEEKVAIKSLIDVVIAIKDRK